jgi:hypothetical protein
MTGRQQEQRLQIIIAAGTTFSISGLICSSIIGLYPSIRSLLQKHLLYTSNNKLFYLEEASSRFSHLILGISSSRFPDLEKSKASDNNNKAL